jgi:peptidoglycan hydrolase-like protein with peptidoglycan-binding domain
MEYCGNCGEAAEGRFCRMCGAPVGMAAQVAAPAEANQMVSAAPGYAGEPTQMVGQRYGGEPTELISPTPAEFDSLFRSEDGQPGMHGQTQLLPPVVEADYSMAPPRSGAAAPPGAAEYDRYAGDDEPRSNRPVILATVGAVVVAAGVILGLLYLGNQSTNSPASSGTPAAGVTSSATTTAGAGPISIPSDGATITTGAPTTAATSAAAGAFQGDSLPLGPGSQGGVVKWVQEKLKQLNYYQGSATGTFDQATAVAVQQFQAAAGVTGDPASTVGLHTLVALEAAGSTPNLHMGSRASSEIGRLNAALSYATGTKLSGDRYTMSTAAAVLRYQQAVGLTPTGQVDAATWAKLQTGTLATSG